MVFKGTIHSVQQNHGAVVLLSSYHIKKYDQFLIIQNLVILIYIAQITKSYNLFIWSPNEKIKSLNFVEL